MNYQEANLKSIFKNNPNLEQSFKQNLVPLRELIIENTPSGYPTAKLNSNYIHSRYNPKKEAEEIIKKNTPAGISCAFILGFGLGYLTEVFLQSFPGIPLIVIEPDISFFKEALSSRNMDHFLSNDSLTIFLGGKPQEIAAMLPENLPASAVQIYRLRAVFLKDRQYYRETEAVIKAFISRKEINANTLKRFGKLWVKNLIRNIHLFSQYPGVSVLEDLFSKLPVIIVAAGPSTDKTLPLISALAERAIIIAVDTALKPVTEFGLEPDFIIIVDPQYWNTKYLEWVNLQKSFFIAEPATNPRIFRLLNINGFFSGSLFPLGKYFESVIGEKGTLGAGGSVTTTAWDFARFLGCSPIYLAGMDLGFPAVQTHCKNTALENIWYSASLREKPAELYSFLSLNSASPFYDYSFNGNKILTDRRMFIYKNWFENKFLEYGETATFILTKEGLKLKNIETIEPEQLLKLPVIRDTINKKLTIIRKTYFQYREKSGKEKQLYHAIENLEKDLTAIEKLAEEGISRTLELKSAVNKRRGIKNILDELNRIDSLILSLNSRDIAGFLLQNIVDDINRAGLSIKTDKILDNSLLLYRQLMKSSQYHRKLLRSISR